MEQTIYPGFPARSLTKRISGDASTSGEWVTAYRAEQKRHLRAVLSSCLRDTRSSKERRKVQRTLSDSNDDAPVLDMRFLLHHCCITNPKDLCVCHISGMDLKGHTPNDLSSLNHLPLDAFKAFPLLHDLELSLNGITDVHLSQKDFSRLQKLDLSYNSVSSLAMLALGELPLLKELHLTGNDIHTLPVEFSRPVQLENDNSVMKIRYPALESLWLDDNKLCDQVTFATLAGLRKLKYLNMDNNEIYCIPQLKLLGTSPMKAVANSSAGENQRKSKTEGNGNEDGCEYPQIASSCPTNQEQQGINNDVTFLSATSNHLIREAVQSKGAHTPTNSALVVSGDAGERSAAMAPFPNLETLSIVHNLLLLDESLVACGEWPVLKELIIYGNPITRTSKGVSPLIQAKLVKEEGIKIVWHKPHLKNRRFAGMVAKRFTTISSAPPCTIPKQPILLEGPPLALDRAPTPPSYSSSSTSTSPQQDTATDQDAYIDRKSPGVFMTQVQMSDDVPIDLPPLPALQVQPDPTTSSIADEFEMWKRDAATRHKDAPSRYKGFEVLLDTYEDASLPQIYDTKSCTQALRHALKHPLVLPDYTGLSRPLTTGKYLLRNSSTKPTRLNKGSKVKQLKQILHDMHERGSVTDTSLALLLKESNRGRNSSDVEEGKKLLEEMQFRYKQVRATSLKVLEPITDIKSSLRAHNPDQQQEDSTTITELRICNQ